MFLYFCRHHAVDIRRQAAAELKVGGGGGSSTAAAAGSQQQQLLAAAIGRTSVQYARHHAAAAAAAPPPPPTPPSSVASHSRLSAMPSTASITSSSPSLAFQTGTTSSDASVEPLDYEEFVSERQRAGDRDPLAHVFDFPPDDIEVKLLPRKIRTMGHILPEEPP